MATRGLGLGLNLGFTKGQLTGVRDWTPDDLDTAPIGWYDANDGDTITLNGSDVSSWSNKGTGLAVSQATASLQPAYSSTAFNGKPVIIFDSDALEASADMTGIRAAFFVTDDLDGSTQDDRISPIFGELGSDDYSFVYMEPDYTVSVDGTGATSGRAAWGGALSLTSGGNIDLGVSLAEKTSPALFYLDYDTGVPFGRLGSFTNGTFFYYLRGRIAEAIFLTERPTTAIRQKMEGYLAHKWFGAGSANTLPSGHPYKDNPPTAEDEWVPGFLGESLVGWFDADDDDTITLNGTDVSSWSNKGSSGGTASQGTASLQPAYLPTGFNAKPVLRADEDGLLCAYSAIKAAVFVAGRARGCDTGPATHVFGGPSGGNEYTFLYSNTSSPSISIDGAAVNSGKAGADGETPISGTNITLGTAFNNDEYAVVYTEYDTAFDLGAILCGPAGGAGALRYSNLDLGEIVFLTAVPSVADRQRLEGYLAHKWWGAGAANTLPSGHPYKDNPPTV